MNSALSKAQKPEKVALIHALKVSGKFFKNSNKFKKESFGPWFSKMRDEARENKIFIPSNDPHPLLKEHFSQPTAAVTNSAGELMAAYPGEKIDAIKAKLEKAHNFVGGKLTAIVMGIEFAAGWLAPLLLNVFAGLNGDVASVWFGLGVLITGISFIALNATVKLVEKGMEKLKEGNRNVNVFARPLLEKTSLTEAYIELSR